MRFGANTFIFRSPFSTDNDLDLVPKLKGMGFDLIEVAVEDPALVDVSRLKVALQEHDLGVVTCGAFGPGRNISSLDQTERQAARDYLIWMIDAAAELGSDVVAGPMYSAVGKARLEDEEDRAKEWNLAVEGLKEMAAYAGEKGVKLAFEPLNRFETDLVNIVDQGLKLIEDVGSSHLGFHLDTFHMHLEEKDSPAAIRRAGDRIFHFHVADSNRWHPGAGHLDFDSILEVLEKTGYDGFVSGEFMPLPDADSAAQKGIAHLRGL